MIKVMTQDSFKFLTSKTNLRTDDFKLCQCLRFQPFCSAIGNLAFSFLFKGKKFLQKFYYSKMHFLNANFVKSVIVPTKYFE